MLNLAGMSSLAMESWGRHRTLSVRQAETRPFWGRGGAGIRNDSTVWLVELQRNWNVSPWGWGGVDITEHGGWWTQSGVEWEAWAIGGDEGQDRHRVDRVGRLG